MWNPKDIKRLRETLDLTQRRFAYKVGVSLTTISRWEQGHCKPCTLARARLREIERHK